MKSHTLPKTNILPLKMDGWNTTFLLGRPIFRGYVGFREGNRHHESLTYKLPETNMTSPLKMDGFQARNLFFPGGPIFRCHVSFREGRISQL